MDLCSKICLLLNAPALVGTTLRCRRNSRRFDAGVPEKKLIRDSEAGNIRKQLWLRIPKGITQVPVAKSLAILWPEQVTFWWDDDGVYFILDQQRLSTICIVLARWKNYWLIDWCLTPTLAIFQLYRGVHWKDSPRLRHHINIQHSCT
jgi:hypothetical protein